MSHTQLGLGFGTSGQIETYNASLEAPFEPVFDTTNMRLVVMLGTGPGNKVAMASESYVDAKVAAIASGNVQNLYLFNSCT